MNSAEQSVTSILDSITDGLVTVDRAWRYTYVNPQAEQALGRRRSDLLGQCVWEVYPACVGTACERRLRRAAAEQVTCDYESHDPAQDRWYDNRAFPMPDGGVAVSFRDITERKRAEGLLEVQRRVLECVSTDAPLAEVLQVLARAIEGQAPAMACSVLLLDEGGGTLRHGAAPSLPADYCRAVDGLAIGPRAGSCGTAAHLGRPVVVADIAADPLWAEYRALALPHGLRACWSTPIVSPAGRVLGTLAVYHRQPRGPDEYDLRLVAVSTHLAALAIERKRSQEALRESEARFQAFMGHSPAVAWMKDEHSRFVYVNRTWE